jgi:type II secretory pathway component HofQ
MVRELIAAAAIWAALVCAPAASSQTQPSQSPTPLPPLPATQLDQGILSLDSPRRLTLTFAEPRPIHEVLDLLVRGTPFSLAVDPNAQGMFTGDLKQLTLREALTTLLLPLGLDFSIEGTVISVFRKHPETRVFDLDVINVTRGWQRTVGGAAKGGGGTLTSTTAADDVFAGIGAGIHSLLSESGDVHIDRGAGLATVTDFRERLDRVASYLETLHIRSSREVHLQARILDVTLTGGASIDWRGVRHTLGLPPDSVEPGLSADIDAVQGAIAAQGTVSVISAPDVITLNNEPAILRAGTPGEALFTLTVIPQISADGLIQLSVSPSWDERIGTDRSAGAGVMRVSDIDTIARVRDGNTVPLSGFVHSSDVTQKVGGFGALFGVQQRSMARAELVVLIRARVVTPAAAAAGSRR